MTERVQRPQKLSLGTAAGAPAATGALDASAPCLARSAQRLLWEYTSGPSRGLSELGITASFLSQPQFWAQAGDHESDERCTEHSGRLCPPKNPTRSLPGCNKPRDPDMSDPQNGPWGPGLLHTVPLVFQGPRPALRLLCCSAARLSTLGSPNPLPRWSSRNRSCVSPPSLD